MKNKKSIILFINGFSEKSDTWNILEANIRSDILIQNDYNFYNFDCSGKWKEEWLKDGNFEKIYRDFENWVQDEDIFKKLRLGAKNHNCDLFFIGCGLGSLLVLNHIRRLLTKDEQAINFNYLRLIREVILISPPINGVRLKNIKNLTLEKNVFFSRSKIANKKFLNFLNNEISSIYNYTIDNIINADGYGRGKCPIPIAVIANENDDFYSQKPIWTSSKAWINISSKSNTLSNHGNVQEELLKFIKKFISSPIGHRNIFEIQDRLQLIKVEPFLENKKEILFGDRKKIVHCNAKGTSINQITFSKNNICHKPFLLRYATTAKGGGLIGKESPQSCNVASAEMKGRYLKDAKEYVFQVIPKDDDDNIYTLNIEIYKGMDLPDNTNVHFHLYKGISFFNKFSIQFDLSEFLRQGYKITKGPFLYLIDEELHSCNETYKDRVKENLINPLDFNDNIGIWEWEFTKQRTGVIDLIWGIEEKGDFEKMFSSIQRPQLNDETHLFRLKKDLVETLYRFTTLAIKDKRENLIRELPFGGMIKVSGTPLEDILNIVEQCIGSKEKFDTLLDRLRFYEGNLYLFTIVEDKISKLINNSK